MFDWLHGWAGLILGFSGLIFIHELGHFVLAKWNGVRVHVFSIGMGPYLVSFTWGETVYALSLIPIGGYVKLMGQDDLNPSLEQNKDPKDYRNKRPGQKAAILAAGAGFNLAFTIIAFTSCYMIGMTVEPPRIGSVAPGTPLAKAVSAETGQPAKLNEGDRILEVNGIPVKTFLEAMLQISGAPNNKDLQLKIARPPFRSEDTEYVTVQTTKDEKLGASSIELMQYVETKRIHMGFATKNLVVVFADPKTAAKGKFKDMPAAKAGLRLDDVIVRINDVAITEAKQLQRAIRESEGKPQKFHVSRDGNEFDIEITPVKIKDGPYQIGLPMDKFAYVTKVDPQSAAYQQGMRPGALITDFEGTEGQPLMKLSWKNKLGDAEAKAGTLPVLDEDPEYAFEYPKPAQEIYKAEGLGEALGVAWGDTVRFSGNVFTIIRGLFTRDVDTSALSGAVGIGQVMYKVAANKPFLNFIWFLGFISLNLGVLQFVPIPLLDGWHLLMVAVEKLKGSPVPQKVQEAFQYVGILMVGGLLLLATYNDISRMFFSSF